MKGIAPKTVHDMQERQFRRLVRERAASTPGRSIDWAVDYFVLYRPLDRGAVQECAGLAQAHATISKYPSAEASVDLPLTAETLIERDRLMEAMAPAVTRVRQELFSVTAPPFPDAPEKAVKWIEAEAGKQDPLSDDDRLLAKMLLRELEKTMDRCAGLLREELVLSRSSRRLSYLTASESRDVAVVPGSPLDVLEVATRTLSEWTGFNPVAMVSHILTGEPLIFSPVTIRFQHHAPPRFMADAPVQHRVLITLLARDLRFPELRTLFREVRSHLGIVRKKRLSEQDRLLIKTVSGLSGPPEHPTSPVFWKKALAAWNREYPQWRVGHWRSLAKRYAKATPDVAKDSVPVVARDPGEIRVTGTGMQADQRNLAALKGTPEFKKAQKAARAMKGFVSKLVSLQAEGGRRSQQTAPPPSSSSSFSPPKAAS